VIFFSFGKRPHRSFTPPTALISHGIVAGISIWHHGSFCDFAVGLFIVKKSPPISNKHEMRSYKYLARQFWIQLNLKFPE
jgi:hypothetical protein